MERALMTDNMTIPLPYRRAQLDPAPELSSLQAADRLTRQKAPNGEPVWLVTRFEDACQVLGDARFSTARTPQTLIRPAATGEAAIAAPARQPGSFLGYDPPEHTRLRQMVSKGFTARRVNQLQPLVQKFVDQALDAMEQADPPVDLMPAFAARVPSDVICELLGIPVEDRPEFQDHTFRAFDQTLDRAQLIETFSAMRDYMGALIARKRRRPDDSVIGLLIREHGAELSDAELTGIGNLLLVAGHDTTANVLALGVMLLLRHPEQLAALRDNPAVAYDAVEEINRYLSVAQSGLIRTATEDITVGETLITAGDYVMVSIPVANRDPKYHQDPDRFDIHRGPTRHVAFGYGIHHCLGAQLARQELRLALPALFQRFPGLRLAVPVDEIPFRSFATVYGVYSLPVTW